MLTYILFFTGHDGIIPQFSHTKLGLFSHRPDLPPVTTPEHSLLEVNSSKEMLSDVIIHSDVDCNRATPTSHLSQSYRKKCLRKQALSQKTKKDSYSHQDPGEGQQEAQEELQGELLDLLVY